jgi:hypothetical protein
VRVLVLPHSDGDPSRRLKSLIGVGVTRLVARDLLRPPHIIRSRHALVVRTTVPEAAVYENCHSRTEEDDVGRSPNARKRATVEPKTDAKLVEFFAKESLWRSIPDRLPAHACADRGRYRRHRL